MERNPSRSENLIDLRGQLEIQIADAFDAVGIQIDDHFIPDVEPLRMMVHGLGHQRHAGHVSKGSDEVLALEGSVQLAVRKAPSLGAAQTFLHFRIGQFCCRHVGSSLMSRERRHQYAARSYRQQGMLPLGTGSVWKANLGSLPDCRQPGVIAWAARCIDFASRPSRATTCASLVFTLLAWICS